MLKPFSIADPLWKCLCPIWNATAVRRGLQWPRSRNLSHRALRYNTRARRVSLNDSTNADNSEANLYTRLSASARDGNVHGCQRLVTSLLDRGAPLSTSLYNALILSNTDAATGGAWRVRDLLKEMQEERYAPDSTTCHNILKVLAVHPDHLLRADVLALMRRNWFTISTDGYHDLAAGWLREGCLELALEVLDTLKKQAVAVQPWLLDMFVCSLCSAEQIEPAYEIMRVRYESGEPRMSRAVWYDFLDAASNARHLAGTKLAWTVRVGLGQLQASTGIVENVLATASHHGAPALATQAMKHLSGRGDSLQHLDYQHLIDSYINHESIDLEKALSVLSIMAVERLQPTKWQTRSMYMYMRDSPELTEKAAKHIQELHKKGRLVPLAAINLIIECYAYQGEFGPAKALYKQVPDFLSNGPADQAYPDAETFYQLFNACKPSNIRQVDSLFSEMLASKIYPDQSIYNQTVYLNASAAIEAAERARDNGEDISKACSDRANRALAYHDNMLDRSFHLSDRSREALAVALSAAGNSRCVEIANSSNVFDDRTNKRILERTLEWVPQDAPVLQMHG